MENEKEISIEEIEELYENSIKLTEITMINDYISLSYNAMKMRKLGFNFDGSESLFDYYCQNIIKSGYDINEIDKLILKKFNAH